MKLKAIISILPLALLLSACGEPEVKLPNADLAQKNLTATPTNLVIWPDDRPSIPDGKLVYEQMQCAQCHGATGSGGSAKVNFADQHWAHAVKPVDLYKVITFGGEPGTPTMQHPAFGGKLTVRQRWDLAVYVRSIGQPALNDKELAAIDSVFGSNCAVCHGTKGDGDGPLARNLEPMPANFQKFDRFFDRTDDVLYDHIANGIKWEGMPNFLGKQDRAKNVKFDEAYIHKLVQYVHKFHVSNAATVLTATNASVEHGPKPAAPAATDKQTSKGH